MSLRPPEKPGGRIALKCVRLLFKWLHDDVKLGVVDEY